MVSEKAIVNAIVGLLATGGSTNHTIHLVAIARAAGLIINWDDFDEISRIIPLLARIYPNGTADVNHFQAAGGLSFVIGELLEQGLLHADVNTVVGRTLWDYAKQPVLAESGQVIWREGVKASLDREILRPCSDPFQPDGGLRILNGNLGRSVIKTSALAPQHRYIEAPARVFDSQDDLLVAFKAGELNRDMVAVVRFQGPHANGMPELHKLVPTLTVLQNRGFKVALVSDGRMSGASGQIPAAIHVGPEAALAGPIAKIQHGDIVVLDCERGTLNVQVETSTLNARAIATKGSEGFGVGRELFKNSRQLVTSAEAGALTILA